MVELIASGGFITVLVGLVFSLIRSDLTRLRSENHEQHKDNGERLTSLGTRVGELTVEVKLNTQETRHVKDTLTARVKQVEENERQRRDAAE